MYRLKMTPYKQHSNPSLSDEEAWTQLSPTPPSVTICTHTLKSNIKKGNGPGAGRCRWVMPLREPSAAGDQQQLPTHRPRAIRGGEAKASSVCWLRYAWLFSHVSVQRSGTEPSVGFKGFEAGKPHLSSRWAAAENTSATFCFLSSKFKSVNPAY